MPGIYSAHDAIIGVQGALGGRGGGLRYLLRDEFTTDRAAGAVNGTAAEPGPGTRTVVDVANRFSITGGAFTGAGNGAWGGNRLIYVDVPIARAAGVLLITNHIVSSTGPGYINGWSTTTTPITNFEPGLNVSSGGLFQLYDGTIYPFVGSRSNATPYLTALILRTAGHLTFIKGGSFTNWTLVYIASTGTTATLYPTALSVSTLTASISSVRVPTAKWLPTPLLSDGFGSAFGTSDGLGHAEGVAGGIGAGGSGVTLSNAGGTWSVSGGKAINTPSVGAEVLTNGDFSSWTGDNPDGWTVVGESGSDPEVSEVGSGESHGGTGTGSANLYTSAGTSMGIRQYTLTLGTWYRAVVNVSAFSGGGLRLIDNTTATDWGTVTTTGTKTLVQRAKTAFEFNLFRLNAINITVDDVSLKALTLSELLTLSNLSCADVYAGVAITKSNTYVQAGLALNWDSASSPTNGLIVYLSGGNIYVDKCVAGTWTNVSNTAYTYSAGARLVCTMNAGALRVYYNGALITTATIVDAGILTGQLHGLFSSDASNTLDDLTIYATGTGGEYSQLDSY